MRDSMQWPTCACTSLSVTVYGYPMGQVTILTTIPIPVITTVLTLTAQGDHMISQSHTAQIAEPDSRSHQGVFTPSLSVLCPACGDRFRCSHAVY